MKRLVGKLKLEDGMGNKSKLMVFANNQEGTVKYELTAGSGTRESLSNLQVGWRGPELPDNTYEYATTRALLSDVVKAIRGGVRSVLETEEFNLQMEEPEEMFSDNDYMEGLILIKDSNVFEEAVRSITSELLKEGFHKETIVEFLENKAKISFEKALKELAL